jgi:3-dehydroquinate synthetase
VTTSNNYFTIDDLPLSRQDKEIVLAWFARKLWVLLEEGSGDPDYYHKSYDPLSIEGNTAHSYVFSLRDGGRHHNFETLEDLEKMLIDEGITRIKGLVAMAAKEECEQDDDKDGE